MKILKIGGLCFGALLLLSCTGISSQPAHQPAEVVGAEIVEVVDYAAFYPAFVAQCADARVSPDQQPIEVIIDSGEAAVLICAVKTHISSVNIGPLASVEVIETVDEEIVETCVPVPAEDPKRIPFFVCLLPLNPNATDQ